MIRFLFFFIPLLYFLNYLGYSKPLQVGTDILLAAQALICNASSIF